MWEIWSGFEGRSKGPNTTAAPHQGDVKQKYVATTRFNEVFQNDSSQVITLLKRVKTETVFKHQLPFYKIPIGFFFNYKYVFFLAPLSSPKECISMATDLEEKKKKIGWGKRVKKLF